MTDLLPTARAIVRACLAREFCNPRRKLASDPFELRRELERYCKSFGVSTLK